MKKIIFLCLLSLITSGSIFAIPGPGTLEKIRELFYQQFPEIQKATFFSYGNSYKVYFRKKDSSSEMVSYNMDGEITKTIKYYNQSGLDPFIKGKLYKEFKGKAIFAVSEVQSDTEHFYKVILQDNNKWYIVISDDKGSLNTEKIFNKG